MNIFLGKHGYSCEKVLFGETSFFVVFKTGFWVKRIYLWKLFFVKTCFFGENKFGCENVFFGDTNFFGKIDFFVKIFFFVKTFILVKTGFLLKAGFQSIGLLGQCFLKVEMAICLSVCLFVCVCVCSLLRYRFYGLFAPTSRSWMYNIFIK